MLFRRAISLILNFRVYQQVSQITPPPHFKGLIRNKDGPNNTGNVISASQLVDTKLQGVPQVSKNDPPPPPHF